MPSTCSFALALSAHRRATGAGLRVLCGINLFLAFSLSFAQSKPTSLDKAAFARFETAINQVHVEKSDLAQAAAEELRRSHPKSGCAEVLEAEMLSTFNLALNNPRDETYRRVMQLTSGVIHSHPRFSHAYVARARAQLKTRQFEAAEKDLRVALAIAPNNAGAYYARALIHEARDDNTAALADYQRFIESTPDQHRQANGHYAVGKIWESAAHTYCVAPSGHVSATVAAFEASAAKAPEQTWRQIKLAIVLVGLARNYQRAESVASDILTRNPHESEAAIVLAAARYQPLNSIDIQVSGEHVLQQIEAISVSTGVTLEQTVGGVQLLGGFAQQRLQWLLEKVQWRLQKNAGIDAPMPAALPCGR